MIRAENGYCVAIGNGDHLTRELLGTPAESRENKRQRNKGTR